jgi:hypothetical protein
MLPTSCSPTVPIPPPTYQRAQAKTPPALHLDALTLVTRLHLLTLCRVAVRLAQRRCPPPLPAGPGGHPRVYAEESLLLIALLRTLWRLSYQDMHDWLRRWPALALACGLPLDARAQPRIPSPSQQWKRERVAGAPVGEALLILAVQVAIRCRLIGARDLIIDSAPILAWWRRDPDAQVGHAPAHHPRPHLSRLSGAYPALPRFGLAIALSDGILISYRTWCMVVCGEARQSRALSERVSQNPHCPLELDS